MMPKTLPRGPVMADVESFRLTDEEKERLLDPAIGGVILFRRNFQDREHLTLLVQEISALRHGFYPSARHARIGRNVGRTRGGSR